MDSKDNLSIIVNGQHAELARLRAKADSLAAENRLLRDAICHAAPLAWAANSNTAEAAIWEKAIMEILAQIPHTTREVERVKKLEAVAEAARNAVRQLRAAWWWSSELESALAALDKLSKDGDK